MSLLEERMREPLHEGRPDGTTGSGSVGNPACGDVVTVHVRVEADRIVAAGFDSFGSAYQLAAASVLCDCIMGETVAEALERTPRCVLKRIPDLPESKHHLARLALEAARRALVDDSERGGEESHHEPAMTEAEAEQFVAGLLSNGRRWGTREIEAMARAEGLRFAEAPVRFLAGLRRTGIIDGAMDAAVDGGPSWKWWLTAPARDDP